MLELQAGKQVRGKVIELVAVEVEGSELCHIVEDSNGQSCDMIRVLISFMRSMCERARAYAAECIPWILFMCIMSLWVWPMLSKTLGGMAPSIPLLYNHSVPVCEAHSSAPERCSLPFLSSSFEKTQPLPALNSQGMLLEV